MGKRSDIKPLPSWERLNELFVYDPMTGDLRWKSIPANFKRAKVGDLAGTVGIEHGYRVVGIDRVYYYVHRIIWKMVTGLDPVDQVDHEDTDRLNNRWSNLREAANGLNIQNSRLRKDNVSGVKGVCWDKGHKKWRAIITSNGKTIRLGRYSTVAEAGHAINQVRLGVHGDFARIS